MPRLVNSLCDTVLQYGYEEKRAIIDGALVRDILNDRANGQLLALMERSDFSRSAQLNGVQMNHAGRAMPFADLPEKHNVAIGNEPLRYERRPHHAPDTGDQLVAKDARGGISLRGQATRKRPKSLDDALKALSESLD